MYLRDIVHRQVRVSLIKLTLGRFQLSEDQASDDLNLGDLQGTLSPGKPMFAAHTRQKRIKRGNGGIWESVSRVG